MTDSLKTFLAGFLALGLLVGGPASVAAQDDQAVEADAVVHAVAGDTVNLTHEPIPAIGWPQMTMDLSLLDGADATAVEPGDAVTIELRRAPSGMFGISRITPKGE